ncbi:MAG: hypothetical protein ACOY0R_09690 [Chloroflexota bacterium]
MPEQPALPRYTSENTGSSLKFVIPSRKNWFIILFMGGWLFFWALGEFVVVGVLIGGLIDLIKNGFVVDDLIGKLFGGGFFLVWIIGWTVGGGVALYTWLWQFAGKEIIEVTGESILVTHKIMKFEKSKEFLVTHISDLRVAPITPDNVFGLRKNRFTWGVPPGTLAFDYGAKTINFGSGCEEGEAKMILKEIWQTYPQYKPQ